MKLLNLYIEREDFKTLYSDLSAQYMALNDSVERWSMKASDAMLEISRLEYELGSKVSELEDLKHYVNKKTAPDQLHDIAERLREAEKKAELYDRHLSKKRERNKKYRERLKAAKR